MSSDMVQEKIFKKHRINLMRNEDESRRNPKRFKLIDQRHKSRTSSGSTALKSCCNELYVSKPTDGVSSKYLLLKTNNLTIYKNDDIIILPKRKQKIPEPPVQCFFCGQWYNRIDNISGACKEAPDPVERTIRILTCYPIAQGAVYHCFKSNDDVAAKIGRFGQGYDVCSYGPNGTSFLKRLKRWLFVALMSLMLPCLCCYMPVHSLYKCFGGGRRGRHQSLRFSSDSEK